MKRTRFAIVILAVAAALVCLSRLTRGGDSKEQNVALAGYWADYGPTALLDDVEGAEMRFKEWCELLKSADAESQSGAVAEFVELMVADEVCYHVWSEWARIYLYGVWSPVRNDEAFGMLLQAIATDPRVPADGRDYVPRLMDVLAHNRVGDMAEDIRMYDAAAQERHLADFRGRRLLLLIIDVTCPSCVDTMQEIEDNRRVMGAAERGELAMVVVTINQTPESITPLVEDKKNTPWQIFCSSVGELDEAYYDTEAAPVMFLLSEEGRVEVGMTRDVEALERAIR